LDWLDDLAGNTSDNQANFFTEVLKRHRNIIAMNETEEDLDNDDILFRMASAELDPSEPHYAERRRNFIKKTADKIRNKVRRSGYRSTTLSTPRCSLFKPIGSISIKGCMARKNDSRSHSTPTRG